MPVWSFSLRKLSFWRSNIPFTGMALNQNTEKMGCKFFERCFSKILMIGQKSEIIIYIYKWLYTRWSLKRKTWKLRYCATSKNLQKEKVTFDESLSNKLYII